MPDESESLAWLRSAVAVMRELGVSKWNGIELGPSPAAPGGHPMTPEQRAEREKLAEMQRLHVQFAHSRVVPRRRGGEP